MAPFHLPFMPLLGYVCSPEIPHGMTCLQSRYLVQRVVAVGYDIQGDVYENILKEGRVGQNGLSMESSITGLSSPRATVVTVAYQSTGPAALEPFPVSGRLTFTLGASEGDGHISSPTFIPFKLLPFKVPTRYQKLYTLNTLLHPWLKF